MPLTVTTDLTVITTAETVTGWSAIGAQSPALEPDFWVQGTSATTGNCISRAVSGNGTDKGMVFDNGAGIDFTAGTHKDKLVYIWMRCNTPQLIQTRANGGLKVRLCTTSATADFREWYVDGSDTIAAPDGWICYVIDPQSAGSATTGSYSAANVRYYGGSMITTTTAKGQNLGIDQISYGRGEIYVSGTVTTAGEGFKEIAAVAYDAATTNRWGIITVKDSIFFVKGKIIIGHATANTDFSSRNETVVFQTPDWRNASGNIVKQIPDASVGATAGADGRTTYNGLAFQGGTGSTVITMGVIVGADGGRSGPTFQCPQNSRLTTPGRTTASIATSDASMGLSMYNCTIVGFEGAVDLYGTNVSGDDLFATGFNGCGRIRSNMEIRNCTVLNSVAAVDDGAYLWESTTDLQDCLFVNNSRAIVFEATTGSPFTFTNLTFGGNTFDVRNESTGSITINIVGSDTPTVENNGGGSATTLVINPVSTTITALESGTLAAVVGARVLVKAASGGPMPFEKSTTITRSGSVATATCAAHGLVDGTKAFIKGATQPEYNGVYVVTVTGANTFTYTVSGTPTTPATGTITTTGVVIDGVTNGSGIISDTRSHAASQPITGKIRRATTGTKYRTYDFSGTIDSGVGFSTTAQMALDE